MQPNLTQRDWLQLLEIVDPRWGKQVDDPGGNGANCAVGLMEVVLELL